MPVSRLLVEMPSWELTEWAGYWKIRNWENEVGKASAEFVS
jgi:hypothetical protein